MAGPEVPKAGCLKPEEAVVTPVKKTLIALVGQVVLEGRWHSAVVLEAQEGCSHSAEDLEVHLINSLFRSLVSRLA